METSGIEDLEKKLEALISRTEEIYLGLAMSFPELFKELELGFEKSGRLVAYFEGDISDAEERENCGEVEDIIAEAREVIAEASDFFTGMRERDSVMFSSINRGIENLTSLEERIEKMREDSIEMELIALNAMTGALQTGRAGRGFSYIANELKKLSSRTLNYTRELTNQGENTLGIFHAFRKTMEAIQSFQAAFYSDFHEKLNSSFESYKQGVKKLADILFGVIEEAKKVKEPLQRIMEEVQLQDIIEQSVMHVIISLEEIEADLGADCSDKFLNEISFVERIGELCVNLLEDVQAKIQKSSAVFGEKLSSLRRILGKVEEERSAFLDLFRVEGAGSSFSSGGDDGGALNRIFSESLGVLEELLEGIERSMGEKKRIGGDGKLIVEGLKLLEESFKNFFDIVDRFYPIEVFSRIEVAKQRVLQDSKATVEEMTRLTDRIEEDMRQALEIIKEAMRRTDRIIGRYSKEMEEEIGVVEQMGGRIKESYERLISSKTSLSESLQSFSVYTERFFRLLDSSEGDMERLGELIDVIDGIKEELRLIRAEAGQRKRKALQEMGLEEWKIKDSKMAEMIERFTIFTHKEPAGAIGGFEVEQGGEGGEVTLF